MADKTTPTKGGGALLYMATAAGAEMPDITTTTAWTRLAKVKDLAPPELTVETSSEEYLDSANPDWKEKNPGTKDAGELGGTLAWLPGDAAQKTLVSLLGADKRWWRVDYPNGAIDCFYGYLSSLGKAVPKNESMTRTFKIALEQVDQDEARA